MITLSSSARSRVPRAELAVNLHIVIAVIRLIVALLLAGIAVASDFSAKVVGIVDGDTIDVLVSERDPIRVRLFGIDTPEKKQPFFADAKEFTAKLAHGQTVTVQPRGRHYERLVADIVLPDGRVLNQELVRAGLAWWYEKYAPHDEELAKLEREARAEKRGLWADSEPVEPWLWRKAGRATRVNGPLLSPVR